MNYLLIFLVNSVNLLYSAAISTTTADKATPVNTGDVAPTALILVILASAAAVVLVSKKRQDNE